MGIIFNQRSDSDIDQYSTFSRQFGEGYPEKTKVDEINEVQNLCNDLNQDSCSPAPSPLFGPKIDDHRHTAANLLSQLQSPAALLIISLILLVFVLILISLIFCKRKRRVQAEVGLDAMSNYSSIMFPAVRPGFNEVQDVKLDTAVEPPLYEALFLNENDLPSYESVVKDKVVLVSSTYCERKTASSNSTAASGPSSSEKTTLSKQSTNLEL